MTAPHPHLLRRGRVLRTETKEHPMHITRSSAASWGEHEYYGADLPTSQG